MSEDLSIGDWHSVTPETMKGWSETKLYLAMQQNQGGVYDTWARTELARRQFVQAGKLISALTKATEQVRQEVAILSTSSDRVERLTKTLKVYTVWLLVFAAVQIAIAGVQTWKMFH